MVAEHTFMGASDKRYQTDKPLRVLPGSEKKKAVRPSEIAKQLRG